MSKSHTIGLIKELKPKLDIITSLSESLDRVLNILTKEEKIKFNTHINDIRYMICYLTTDSQAYECREYIRDLISIVFAERRNIKIIID